MLLLILLTSLALLLLAFKGRFGRDTASLHAGTDAGDEMSGNRQHARLRAVMGFSFVLAVCGFTEQPETADPDFGINQPVVLAVFAAMHQHRYTSVSRIWPLAAS